MKHWTRQRWFLAGAGLAAGSAAFACSLLDEPAQCARDRDCAQFGAVCDVAQSICVAGPTTENVGPDGAVLGPADATTAVDAPPPDPSCNVSPKPVASASMGLPAGPDGGAQVATATTLGCDKDWTLEGPLVVPAGTTLTIKAGTTLRAKKGTAAAIIVLRGGRLIAEGQRDNPIVMTVDDPAPKAGDWRGLFVLGNAPRTGTAPYGNDPLLTYGGAAADDNSGVVTFLRVEYAQDGIVLGGVGKTTKIDSVQVRQSNDNCFVINGGTFDAKHLVCQQALDEQFEIGAGYAGRLQFVFGQKVAPGDGHNGFLVDGANTSPVLYNATFCGQAQAQNVGGYGLIFRNGTKLDANNTLLTGWLAAIEATGNLGTPVQLRSSVAFGNATNVAFLEEADGGVGNLANDDNGFDELAFFGDGGNKETNPNLVDCHDPKAPKPWPATALSAGARTPPNDGFFDVTANFIGAFKDANETWMTGAWVRFDDK